MSPYWLAQFRSNWVVDPETGEYNSTIRSPTGIASDPALASYGVSQAEQLAQHLLATDPTIDAVYSSPFYRCIQTLAPFTAARTAQNSNDPKISKALVNLEAGLGEFYGLARFDHPSPATYKVLSQHFPENLAPEREPIVVPSTKGESIPQLHDRIAYCLNELIQRLDADPSCPRTLLICTHAASMIAIGRALTGDMPEDECAEDFKCFTCAFSKFERRAATNGSTASTTGESDISDPLLATAQKWDPTNPDIVPDINWRNGRGVQGGWNLKVNGDCSFLENGEERGW
jgi:transcription factor C subunit 7